VPREVLNKKKQRSAAKLAKKIDAFCEGNWVEKKMGKKRAFASP